MKYNVLYATIFMYTLIVVNNNQCMESQQKLKVDPASSTNIALENKKMDLVSFINDAIAKEKIPSFASDINPKRIIAAAEEDSEETIFQASINYKGNTFYLTMDSELSFFSRGKSTRNDFATLDKLCSYINSLGLDK